MLAAHMPVIVRGSRYRASVSIFPFLYIIFVFTQASPSHHVDPLLSELTDGNRKLPLR